MGEEIHYLPNVSYTGEYPPVVIDVYIVDDTPAQDMGKLAYPGNPAGLNIAVEFDLDGRYAVEFQLTKAQLADALDELLKREERKAEEGAA